MTGTDTVAKMTTDPRVQAWEEMAVDGFAAALSLFKPGHAHLRSAVSRAYYAAHSRVVARLLQSGVTMPLRGNPSHGIVPRLILHNLRGLTKKGAANLSGLIDTLYLLRVAADYQPDALVDESDARVSAALMVKLFRELKESQS